MKTAEEVGHKSEGINSTEAPRPSSDGRSAEKWSEERKRAWKQERGLFPSGTFRLSNEREFASKNCAGLIKGHISLLTLVALAVIWDVSYS